MTTSARDTLSTNVALPTEEVYPPSDAFSEQANASTALYDEAEADRLACWATQAERLSWAKPFTEVLDWSEAPFAKWFPDGKLNVAYNCVDRHVDARGGAAVPGDVHEGLHRRTHASTARPTRIRNWIVSCRCGLPGTRRLAACNGDRVAIHWVGEPVDDERAAESMTTRSHVGLPKVVSAVACQVARRGTNTRPRWRRRAPGRVSSSVPSSTFWRGGYLHPWDRCGQSATNVKRAVHATCDDGCPLGRHRVTNCSV